MVVGKLLPMGIGAGIGAVGNRTLGKRIVKTAGRHSARRRATGPVRASSTALSPTKKRYPASTRRRRTDRLRALATRADSRA